MEKTASMTTIDATRANAHTLPEINRRRVLLGAATVPAYAMTAIAPAIAMPAAENADVPASAEIETAFKAVTDARQELVAARDASDWLADEWRHLWPRAPKSMSWYGSGEDVERDIAGRVYRDGDGRLIGIKSRDKLAEYRDWTERPRRLRANASAAMKERARKWRHDRLVEVREMEAYLDETERLRKASGSASVVARVSEARGQLQRSISTLMDIPASNRTDLGIKAHAALISSDGSITAADRWKDIPGLSAAFSVVLDVCALAAGVS